MTMRGRSRRRSGRRSVRSYSGALFRIWQTGTAAEAGAVGVAQGAVVVEAVGVPEARGGGCLPAQVVLAAAELGLVSRIKDESG